MSIEESFEDAETFKRPRDLSSSQFYIEDEDDMSTQEGEEALMCENCGYKMGWCAAEVDQAVARVLVRDANDRWEDLE